MISLDEARRIVVADLAPVGVEEVPLAEACGRTLAAALVATRTQPPFRSSAMDGYAVRSVDLGAAPATLTVIGESQAGRRFDGQLEAGQAVKVSTGAPAPEGADQVVVREDATPGGEKVTLDARPAPGAHVRPAGIDFRDGDELVSAGRTLSPEAVSVAASAGFTTLSVRARPRVAVLSSGDELVEPGAVLDADSIVNSNAVGLAALIAATGGAPVLLGIARDDPADVRAKLEGAQGCDLLVTIGGASVGDHDHLRAVFAELGGALAFEKIAVKPGKPTWFGRLGATPVLGLPGNPVSALVMARLMLAPVLKALLGAPDAARLDTTPAVLAAPLPANGPRETFLRARFVDGGRVAPLANQDSAALSALVAAECLVRRAAGADAAEAGDVAGIVKLDP